MSQFEYESIDFSESPITLLSLNESQKLNSNSHKRRKVTEGCLELDQFYLEHQREESGNCEGMLQKKETLPSYELDEVKIQFDNNQGLEECLNDLYSPSFEVLPLWLEKELSSVKTHSDVLRNDGVAGFSLNHEISEHDFDLAKKGFDIDRDTLEEKSTDLRLISSQNEASETKRWIWKLNDRFECGVKNTPTNILASSVRDCTEDLTKQSTKVVSKAEELAALSSGRSVSKSTSENSYYKPTHVQVVDSENENSLNLNKRASKLMAKEAEETSEGKKTRKGRREETHVPRNQRKRTKLLSAGCSSSKEIVDLAQRRDVVNKTILRVMRRFLTQKLKTNFPQEYEGKEDKQNRFFDNVRNLAVLMFGEENSELDTLHFFLASIIDHKYLKEQDLISAGASESDKTVFYDCLYKYSHTRLVNLFSVEPLGEIYRHFYEEARHSILESEASLSKNRPLYEKVMEEFQLIFQGKIDINTIII